MKNQFIIPSIIIAAAILGVGWMLKPLAQLPKAPDISIHHAAMDGNIEAVKQHITTGTDANVNAKALAYGSGSETPLDVALWGYRVAAKAKKKAYKEIADLIRKHGGKTGEELKAEGK